MALILPQSQKQQHPKPKAKRKKKEAAASSSSWDQFKNLLSCKQIEDPANIHVPSKKNNSSSCTSICSFRDVVHANTRVVHHDATTADTRLLRNKTTHPHPHPHGRTASSSSSSYSYSSRAIQFRKLSGCYECHAVLDPTRYPLPRTTICACPQCGEVFPKIESLQHHQALRHAVSELGAEDSSRNIVEIIFKSSWVKKESPVCKIERILKVHNSQRTIQRFEDYRDGVKIRANGNGKRNARCAADGNELLRFQCATLTCSIGARGSSSLCGSIPACGVCTIIRHGFQGNKITTASSGRAHDCLPGAGTATRRAMLVCRVIAGRVKRAEDDTTYDSTYSNMEEEELHVFSSRAILPCFVVIYKALQS